MGRYTRRGRTKLIFCPTVANLASPTMSELTAGIDLSGVTNEIGGFAFSNSPIATPDLASTFVAQIPGEDTAEDSSVTVYEDDTVETVRTALAKGISGIMVICPLGKVATKRCETWPVTSTGYNGTYSVGNDAATAVVQFAPTAPPNQAATIAA
jgi:hypothetical protein